MIKSFLGYPVIEIDSPELQNKIILFKDWRNWTGIIDLEVTQDGFRIKENDAIDPQVLLEMLKGNENE